MQSPSGSISGAALSRLSLWLQRLREGAGSRRLILRWGFFALPVGLFFLLLYLNVTPLSTAESTYVGSGRRYSADDLSRIGRILDRQRITYRIDDQRRITVAAELREQAETAIAKADIGPRPPGDIRDDQTAGASPWESMHDKEVREHQGREKILEAMISGLPGVVSSFVWINRPKLRWGLQPVAKPSAFVRLETEGDRQLPFRTVQSITTILTANEPGLTADAVTVLDHRGHKYLDAGNPSLSAQSYNRAREEQLSQEILEKLEWITGVRVSVQLPEPVPPADRPASGSSTGPSESKTKPQVVPASGHETASREAIEPVVAVNRPMTADPVPAPAPSASIRSTTAATATSHGPDEPGRIWVRVPRSYYYHIIRLPGHKEPSLEEYQKLAASTEEKINTGISLVVPVSGSLAWKTMIDVIPDELPLGRPPVLPAPGEPRRLALDWGIASVVGITAAACVLFASWVLTGRRPSARSQKLGRGLRFHIGSALAPAPSERVREFVRRNPESAVSVLERWTRQGGEGP
jgi:hypothetical protein